MNKLTQQLLAMLVMVAATLGCIYMDAHIWAVFFAFLTFCVLAG